MATQRAVPAHRFFRENIVMLTTEHLDAYLQAMGNRDVEGTKVHMAENVVLRSPIVPAPFVGKGRVSGVLTQLLATVDAFEPKLLLRDGADCVAVFTIRFGDHVIDGMDHMHLNEAGLVDSMTVAWRPLPSVVAVQQKLAPKLGGKAMMLVPADQSA
ncbi:limonene-1,2-epoxide hydrolase family protein [Paraburkholderia sp. SIMBA_027]|uniref:limonene-1,2-epoxide hydrolase family protein n=1 Tax=Paraburkholderia sp. SIMBA_027 TaxID=3085770 RepID=UPI00397DA974